MRLDRKKYELARAKACKSVKDLESEGIPRGTLCTALQRNVRPETIGKIAKVLDCDVTDIIED